MDPPFKAIKRPMIVQNCWSGMPARIPPTPPSSHAFMHASLSKDIRCTHGWLCVMNESTSLLLEWPSSRSLTSGSAVSGLHPSSLYATEMSSLARYGSQKAKQMWPGAEQQWKNCSMWDCWWNPYIGCWITAWIFFLFIEVCNEWRHCATFRLAIWSTRFLQKSDDAKFIIPYSFYLKLLLFLWVI